HRKRAPPPPLTLRPCLGGPALSRTGARPRAPGRTCRLRRCPREVGDPVFGRRHPEAGRRGSPEQGDNPMNLPLTIECPVHFRGRGPGRRQVVRAAAEPLTSASPPARVPRIARLMALALRFDELIRKGEVADYAELARLGRVSRARVSQIMALLGLSPAIQK